METLDPAGEFLRISEHYRRMSDSELLVLAQQRSALTDLAQQALASEFSHRGMEIPVEEATAPPEREPASHSTEADDPYAEDRALVELCKVWSLPDAMQVQWLLDRAGIPFFIGPEKATGVNEGTLNFADGVSVSVMRVGLPWAAQALRDYRPADERPPKQAPELADLPLCCPECHSPEVIFEGLTPETANPAQQRSPKYQWTCDSCGHQWEDDGVAKEE